jgi:hypothetical protein
VHIQLSWNGEWKFLSIKKYQMWLSICYFMME